MQVAVGWRARVSKREGEMVESERKRQSEKKIRGDKRNGDK